MSKEIKINIYRDGDYWYGARWIDGEYDGVGELVPANATESEAREYAMTMPLLVTGKRTVVRVEDL